VFFINIPIGIVVMLLGRRLLPAPPNAHHTTSTSSAR
jgi:hypothetical protein